MSWQKEYKNDFILFIFLTERNLQTQTSSAAETIMYIFLNSRYRT